MLVCSRGENRRSGAAKLPPTMRCIGQNSRVEMAYVGSWRRRKGRREGRRKEVGGRREGRGKEGGKRMGGEARLGGHTARLRMGGRRTCVDVEDWRGDERVCGARGSGAEQSKRDGHGAHQLERSSSTHFAPTWRDDQSELTTRARQLSACSLTYKWRSNGCPSYSRTRRKRNESR